MQRKRRSPRPGWFVHVYPLLQLQVGMQDVLRVDLASHFHGCAPADPVTGENPRELLQLLLRSLPQLLLLLGNRGLLGVALG